MIRILYSTFQNLFILPLLLSIAVLFSTTVFAQSATEDPFVLRINSGGNMIQFENEQFLADSFFKGNGKSYTNTKINDIKNTSKDAIYLSERSTTQNLGSFEYVIPMENGNYTVNLHFAEIWWGATGGRNGGNGKRIFSVKMEGKDILSSFDINQEVGTMTAVVKTYEVMVTDGELNLNFSAEVNQPKLSALEIFGKESPSEPQGLFVKRINSGGGELSFGDIVFEGDRFFDGDLRTYFNKNITQINGTSQDELYVTERTTSSDSGEFEYKIPLQNGDYTIKLHFAEIYWGAPGSGGGGSGKRIFNVAMEGKDVLVNYDINAETGAVSAVVKSFEQKIGDGELNLRFYSSVNRPKLSAIEIFSGEEETELPVLTRINSGGGQLTVAGTTFKSDTYFTGDGKSFANTSISDIKNTEQDIIYKTERSTKTNNGTFGYAIPVTDGNYSVKLHFAEIYWGATNGGPGSSGKRVFNVNIEGKPVLVNYDINEEVGAMTATIKTFNLPVSDGELSIDFSANVNQPKLSALELYGNGKILAPTTNNCEWNELAKSSFERLESQSAKVNGKLYILAGFMSGLKINNATEIYDPQANSWSTGAPMPVAVTHMGIAVAENEIWVLAGFVGNHPGTATQKVQIYNTSTDSWRNGPNLPNARGSGTATYNKGKIHFFGGLKPDRKTDVGEHFILDLDYQNLGWQSAAPMPNPRNHLSSASVNGIVYAIGGQYGHDGGVDDQKFLHAYNPDTNNWTKKTDLPSDRSHFEPGTLVHNNKIIIAGGRRGGFFFDDISQYDPETNSWSELCKLPNPLLAPVAKVFGDKLIISNGGVNGTCCPINNTRWIPIEPESNSQVALKARISLASETKIKIFPNPTSGVMNIRLLDGPQSFQVTISDLTGRALEELKFENIENVTVNLNRPAGIYFVKLRFSSGGEIVQKIIKL